MPDGTPKWEFQAGVGKARRGAPIALNEAETIKRRTAGPDPRIAHQRQLWNGDPIAGRDEHAVRAGVLRHGLTWYAHYGCYESGQQRKFSSTITPPTEYLRMGPGPNRADSLMKLSM